MQPKFFIVCGSEAYPPVYNNSLWHLRAEESAVILPGDEKYFSFDVTLCIPTGYAVKVSLSSASKLFGHAANFIFFIFGGRHRMEDYCVKSISEVLVVPEGEAVCQLKLIRCDTEFCSRNNGKFYFTDGGVEI